MKRILSLLLLLTLLSNTALKAEGTKEVSASANSITSLYLSAGSNQGAYFNCPVDNRIYFRITDFNTERFHFGFRWLSYENPPFTPVQDNRIYYRIFDPAGNQVVGITRLGVNTGDPGLINTFSEAVTGPNVGGSNAAGYNPISFTPSMNGEYYIEYCRGSIRNNVFNISGTSASAPFWDFTVGAGNGASFVTQTGRVHAQKWSLHAANNQFQADLATSIDNASFYARTADSVVVKLNTNPGFRPLAFDVIMNNFGVANNGNWLNDRRSITTSGVSPTFVGGYDIFLNMPDAVPYPPCPIPIVPSIISPIITGCSGTYRIRFQCNTKADHVVVLDLNGTNAFEVNSADRRFELINQDAGIIALNWDGLDGFGNPVPTGTSFPIILSLRKGRVNIPMYDAEINSGGFSISSIAPLSQANINLFWDDSQLTNQGTCPSSSGTEQTTGAGLNASIAGFTSPTHNWNGPIAGGGGSGTTDQCDDFGNVRVLNSWGWGIQLDNLQVATLACTGANGRVWGDANNSAAGTFSNIVSPGEVGTNAAGSLYAILVEPNSGEVLESVPVNADGTYTFTKVPINVTNVEVRLSKNNGIETQPAPARGSLPSSHVATSQNYRLFNSGTTITNGLEFGVQAYPVAPTTTLGGFDNPFGVAYVHINSSLFTSVDPDVTGKILTYRFTGFPTNCDNFRLNNIVYTAATWPSGGVTITANPDGTLPGFLVFIDPSPGLVTVDIPFQAFDLANSGSNNGYVRISFNNILPVKLLSFNGAYANGTTKLNWLVANQVNTKEYIVERRADNSNQFQAIGKVNATQPNGNNQLTYRYDDVNPLTGTSYYRLKIVDNDGKVEYTNTVRISTAGNIQFDVLTYPNPIQNVLNLAISSDKHQATDLLVYDNAGKLVVKRNLDLQIGNNLFLVDEMGKLSTGLYMVKIANKEGTLFTTKVVKK